jgi:uncharacterized membrane protein (Fun14 family)
LAIGLTLLGLADFSVEHQPVDGFQSTWALDIIVAAILPVCVAPLHTLVIGFVVSTGVVSVTEDAFQHLEKKGDAP